MVVNQLACKPDFVHSRRVGQQLDESVEHGRWDFSRIGFLRRREENRRSKPEVTAHQRDRINESRHRLGIPCR